ncbi:MAG: hotdog fold thioesterase [Alphaproteobacteria bacterium]
MTEIWHTRPTIKHMRDVHIDTAVDHLGIEFTEVGDDFIRGRMPVDRRTVQPYGIVHGGASMVLAETLASSAAAACVDQARYRVFGQEINGNHLRPCSEGWVTGTARPYHLGRKSQVWSIEIVNDAGKLTCISRLTMAVVAI